MSDEDPARSTVRRWSERWSTSLGLVLLVGHVLGMALVGFTRGGAMAAYAATALGVVAVPLLSWRFSRLIDRWLARVGRSPALVTLLRLLTGAVLVALAPVLYNTVHDAPLPLLSRLLELCSVAVSIAVMTGLVVSALSLADLLYLLTANVRRLSTRLMVLLLVTSLGTFFWLSYVGMEAHTLLGWAIERGHLQIYARGVELLSKQVAVYVGYGLAGALGVELPFVLLMAWRFGRNATAGLEVLHRGFHRVALGDLAEPVPVTAQDEVGEMQRGFNAMLEAARERHFLETAFGRYVSPVVLERMREKGGEGMLGGERREATVMFSDIRGFTAMSATLAPERVIAVLNRYMSLMIETIATYGGYINKFVGDAILVVFNVPLDQPDHALRALACARAMQDALTRANEEGAFSEVGRVEMGIGINTGALVAGNLGNERQVEFTVLGDTVNVASRACSQAAPREVVITETVVTAARRVAVDEIEIASHGTAEIKGKGQMELFTLAGDRGLEVELDEDTSPLMPRLRVA